MLCPSLADQEESSLEQRLHYLHTQTIWIPPIAGLRCLVYPVSGPWSPLSFTPAYITPDACNTSPAVCTQTPSSQTHTHMHKLWIPPLAGLTQPAQSLTPGSQLAGLPVTLCIHTPPYTSVSSVTGSDLWFSQ